MTERQISTQPQQPSPLIQWVSRRAARESAHALDAAKGEGLCGKFLDGATSSDRKRCPHCVRRVEWLTGRRRWSHKAESIRNRKSRKEARVDGRAA